MARGGVRLGLGGSSRRSPRDRVHAAADAFASPRAVRGGGNPGPGYRGDLRGRVPRSTLPALVVRIPNRRLAHCRRRPSGERALLRADDCALLWRCLGLRGSRRPSGAAREAVATRGQPDRPARAGGRAPVGWHVDRRLQPLARRNRTGGLSRRGGGDSGPSPVSGLEGRLTPPLAPTPSAFNPAGTPPREREARAEAKPSEVKKASAAATPRGAASRRGRPPCARAASRRAPAPGRPGWTPRARRSPHSGSRDRSAGSRAPGR